MTTRVTRSDSSRPARARTAAAVAGTSSSRDARRPLVAQLVVLVLDQPRGNPPCPRVAHPGLLSSEPGKPGGLPGDPGHLARKPRILTVVLTGDKRRPSGQGPGARLIYGLVSQRCSASRAARPIVAAPPAPRPLTSPHGTTRAANPPRSGSDPRQPATSSPAPHSQGTATAAAIRLI